MERKGIVMIVNDNITEYLQKLASADPAPGGGAVCALTGAQGIALVMMVANLTIGKAKYAEYEDLNRDVLSKCEGLLQDMTNAIDADAEAFSLVASAYALPHATDDERAARTAAIARASLSAAEVPLASMRTAIEVLRLNAALVGRSNANLASDLYVSALVLLSCITGAQKNVEVNLPYIDDPDHVHALQTEADSIFSEAGDLADRIITAIM